MAGRVNVWFILGLVLIGTVAASYATGVAAADHERRVLFKDKFNKYPEGSWLTHRCVSHPYPQFSACIPRTPYLSLFPS